MRRAPSLRTRVSVAATLALALWVVAVIVAVNLVLANRWQAQADDVLQGRAEAAAETVDVDKFGRVTVDDPRNDALIDVGTWVISGGRVLEGPKKLSAMAPAVEAAARKPGRFTDLPSPARLRLYSYRVMVGSRQAGTVVTSLSVAPYQDSNRSILVGSVAVGLLMIGGAFLVIRAAVTSALRPVQAMTRQANDWADVDTDRRFGHQPLPRELADLASTLDGWLARLSAMLRHEKQFVGELSHELRTPLARIIVEAELVHEASAGDQEHAASAASIARSAREMSDILETLLATARTETGAVMGRCEVIEVVEGLVCRLGAAPGLPRVVVDPGTTPAYAGLDAPVLERAIAPVLDNALRYARQEVRIGVTLAESEVLVDVADDGPGVPVALRDQLFEPGRRGDVDDGHEGAGLGLALARRLIAAAGGKVTLEDSDVGATFRLALPRG